MPKLRTLLAILVGLALLAFLIASNDWSAILRTVAGAGWALAVVVLLHLPQTAAAAWSWRVLIPRGRPGLVASYNLRWVRDSINTLLPVAQVGGDVARVRLQVRTGTPPAEVTAATVTDVALEVVAQIVFTMAAVLLLALRFGRASHTASVLAWSISAGCVVLLLVLAGARRFGLLGWLSRAAAKRLGSGSDDVTGAVEAAEASLRARTGTLAANLGGHIVAWGLGSVETWAALWAVGVPSSYGAALVIEALGHVARAVGVVIPGALGVQEGGYVLVCGLYGIGSAEALSLSLVKRLRELILGVPGLVLWGWLERRMTNYSSG